MDGMEDPYYRQEDLVHEGTSHGAVNSPLQIGLEKKDEAIKTKKEELKCNRFVLGFQTGAVFRL